MFRKKEKLVAICDRVGFAQNDLKRVANAFIYPYAFKTIVGNSDKGKCGFNVQNSNCN